MSSQNKVVAYTIGNLKNYLEAIERHGSTLYKSPGGYVFKTVALAQKRIVEEQQQNAWAVWVVECDWDKDTQPSSDGWWDVLTSDEGCVH